MHSGNPAGQGVSTANS